MIVTEQEYQSMKKVFNGLDFTPISNIIYESTVIDGKETMVIKHEIIKTADEVYQIYVKSLNQPPVPTTKEKMLKEIANLKIENMKKDTIISNTLKSIADLKLEVVSMKGGN
ncbi:hypothetical protein [Clostridium butyricum]|uniref:hypothetical protein n=1 Tax=Clostridium butyricum TaxID=1492 RepID=UPI00374FD366